MRRRLAQGEPLSGVGERMTILRSLPHGNVDAVLTTLRTIGLEQIIASRPCRERDLVIAMIADRVISPGSKLSCSRGRNEETAQNTLADELSLGDVDVHELYKAMDWLLTFAPADQFNVSRRTRFRGLDGYRTRSGTLRSSLVRAQPGTQ